jgi:Mrp family chromosome partitioning ATPase
MQNVPEHISTPQGAEADQSAVVVASESMLTREDRWSRMGQKGGVVWLTGLSASGKSTISRNLEWQLHQEGRKVFALDGDNLRLGLCDDLGFSEKDRNENLRRAGHVALLMAETGLIVLCAFISPYNLQRSELRTLCGQRSIPFLDPCREGRLDVGASTFGNVQEMQTGLLLKKEKGLLVCRDEHASGR